MADGISRRLIILIASLVSVVWAGLAQASPLSFTVPLTGAEQVPPNETTGKGSAAITYDPTTRVVTWTITYSGLSGPATMAHFHGPADKGKNAPVVIWLSTKGSPAESPFKGEATLTPEQAQDFTAGKWYVNVHTQANPGGEIRGQVVPPPKG
jgi:CHRD domain